MPKILIYITAKVIWQFLFWNTDYYENRAHVHVGKKGTEHHFSGNGMFLSQASPLE